MKKRQRSKRKKSMEKKQAQEQILEREAEIVVKREELEEEEEEEKENPVEEAKSAKVVVIKQEKEEEEDEEGEREASPPPSTSTVPQEAVVAQLNQLQQTLQQQMLSQLSSNTTTMPQITITPQVKNERKRPASSMSNNSENREESGQVGEMHFKRKRTAFNEKQYKVLETTFEHNNFPEPIDQHCIALRIKTPYRSIKMWFQNRRASIRKRLSPKEKGASPGDNKVIKNASDPDARWYCTLCPSTFIAKKFLDSHKEAHERETLYCPHCNMGFTHRVLLDTHKISKCSSKTGVDLTHLEDECGDNSDLQGKRNIKKIRKDSAINQQNSATQLQAALPLLLLQRLQKQQQQQQESPSSPPPLIDPTTLSQLQDNPLIIKQQQQRLMQQLLLAQLQQAQKVKLKSKDSEKEAKEMQEEADQTEKENEPEEKQQNEEDEENEMQQLQLQLQQQIQQQLLLQHQTQQQEEAEEPKGSLTLGGLTIFPVPASSSEENKVRVKKEVKDPALEKQPSTLQDQITAILQSHGLKSTWKTPTGIKPDPDAASEAFRERESMQEQIEAILRHQEEQRRKIEKNNEADATDDTDLNNMKRHRRRTTVFNEVQLRTLYLHFTYCNFPDPSMFKIIGHLTKLEPQVIKIWFQNERSRQRKRATHIVDEVNSKEKPYKCRDCGMSFAMLTFLVKHSMRHNGDTDQDASVRTCPLCLQKWNKEVFASHLKSRHNVNLSLVDEKMGGALMCYLCEETFSDQESLMIHKHKHLKDDYGDPPQCSECKTTFVNAICLEAHMETHRHHEWNYKCNLCGAIFLDKILLTSHRMGHGVPLAPVSTIDRSRSQLQHTSVRAIHARARKTVASAITSLNNSPENIEATSETDSVKSECSVPSNTPVSSPSTHKTSITPTSTFTAIVSPPILPGTPPCTAVTSSSLSNLPFNSSSGPVSYVKLIPVQLVPVNSINNTQMGQKTTSFTTVTSGGITTPTTTFISVPVSLKGSTETNPILNYLLEATSPPPAKVVDNKPHTKKQKNKTLPNLIPISQNSILPLKEINVDGIQKIPPQINKTKKTKEIKNGISVVSENSGKGVDVDSDGVTKETNCHISSEGLKNTAENNDAQDQVNSQGEQGALQVPSKKRYVPILPMIPIQVTSQELPTPTTTEITTTTPQRSRRSRNVPNKRLWQTLDLVGCKRRTPTYFTGNQREILEAHFDHDNFPEPGEQLAISIQLGVDYAVVKTWFQNTRKNYRKQLREEDNYEGDGPYHCHKCNVSYITKKTLSEHYEKHKIETSYHCGECRVFFSHAAVFNTHLMRHMSKAAENKKKKYGACTPIRIAPNRMETSQTYEGDNESTSDSDSQDEGKDGSPDSNGLELVARSWEDSMDDVSEDVDDYHPIMAVECILDNSSEEDYETEAASESPVKKDGHKCSSCEESFASLIALKEHYPLKCIHTKTLRKPGEWRRKKSLRGKRKQKVGNEIRCFECHLVFPDRVSFLEHFNLSRCSIGRQRIEYTDKEQAILLTHYEENNFPMPSGMSLLARRLGVRYRQIMHWFQNRRSKDRKQQKESKYPPVECQNCKASFVTDANLKRHQEVVHDRANKPVLEFLCPDPGCDAVFSNGDLLVTHRLVHEVDNGTDQNEDEVSVGHKLPESPHWKNFTVLEAHYSDNNFPDPMDIGFIARRLDVDPLHIHLWFKERRSQHIHKLEENKLEGREDEAGVTSQKAVSKLCFICNAAFISQTDLDCHREMHKSSWAQVCSVCGKQYSNVIALETHMIRHGIEVKHESEQSSASKLLKTSNAPLSLTQTKILHTHYEHNNFPGPAEAWLVAKRLGLKPKRVKHWFQNKRGKDRRAINITNPYSCICSLCGAAFVCELFLENHKKLHKSNDTFPCEQCGAVFYSAVLRETHLLNHNLVSESKAFFKDTPDGARNLLTEGQEEMLDIVEFEESDGSEPELEIDDTETIEEEADNIERKADSRLGYAKVTPDELENAVKSITGLLEADQKDTKNGLKETTDTEDEEDDASCKSDMEVSRYLAEEISESHSAIAEEKTSQVPEKKIIREEVFFDDNTDSDDDDDDEPRLKIVSAYTISPDTEDLELEESS
ncbi:uncharacterized protein LOC121877707 isoform X2 [Homarus americanus]|uniref:uncharacterized protein LOC121877707 isoform X2 n=1 Tax=Homarus americanus TaxID=6706 RepID=UPI001C4907D2|nr:uncharacterized protein LOC121877707 isoform X2 [Homarus americanus]